MIALAYTDVKQRFVKIMDRFLGHKAELQELACTLYALLWGAVILYYDAFYNISALEETVVFQQMERFAPGVVWGHVLLFFGLWGLVGYIFNVKIMRRIGAMSGVIGWTIISYFLFIDFRPVFGVIAIPVAAIFSMLSFIRLGYVDE